MPHTTEVLLHLTVILVLFNHVVHIVSIAIFDSCGAVKFRGETKRHHSSDQRRTQYQHFFQYLF